MPARIAHQAIIFGLSLLLFTCGSPKPADHSEQSPFFHAETALATAWRMLGSPYQYRGESPAGFDCSGLVRYCYRAAGLDLPHYTGELKQLTRSIADREMHKGDLVFFERKGSLLHVGIYAGDNRFVHAPRPGKSVRIDSLLNPYWKQRFLGARRL